MARSSVRREACLPALVAHWLAATCLCLALNLHLGLASPAVNTTNYLDLFKYEGHLRNEESTTAAATTVAASTTITSIAAQVPRQFGEHERARSSNEHQSDSDLYTLQLGQQHNQRQMKHDDLNVVYDHKCPKQHYIHPCDCLELDKRLEMMEGSGEMPDVPTNSTPTVEMVEEEPLNPDLMETVAFCKNIRNVQVLTEAIRGFQGHRVNYFVLDGCKLPPFPNNLFKGIHVVWMEILNSTLQFHDNFFHTKSCP